MLLCCFAGAHRQISPEYHDDSAVLSLLLAYGDIGMYFSEENRFKEWCTHNFLELNASKTKGVIFVPKSVCAHLREVTSSQTIEQVVSYEYLGIYLDDKLSWTVHVEDECARAQKRLYFLRRLRRLRAFGVSPNILLSHNIFLWKFVSSGQITTPAHCKYFFNTYHT